MEPEARQTAGISDSLLRLSVGIEDPRDLAHDVLEGLERASRVAASEPVSLAAAR
jgi:cystathionine gamma-synthase